MPCAAPSRNNLGAMAPCNIPDVYAGGICKWHWQMKNGLFRPVAGLDPYTVLLLHGESLADAAGHPLTANGGAAVSTAQSKFGGSSLLFDGVDDVLVVSDSPDFTFADGDWTIEFWVYFNNVAQAVQRLIGHGDATTFSWWSRYSPPNIVFYWSLDGTTAAGGPTLGWAPVVSTWYHIAAVRTGALFKLFINGTQMDSRAISGPLYDSALPLFVGAANPAGSQPFNGYLDEVRISKGIARWTTPFSPPTAPY